MVGCKKWSSDVRLEGKVAIVTGSNTGIGKYTVQDLSSRGCRVIMACRSVQKAEEAKADIEQELAKSSTSAVNGPIVIMKLDISSLASVRQFAEEFLREEQRLDLLINNAGIMMCPKDLSVDGFEMQFATNHLGHFLLTLLLLPRIMENTHARIVNVSSDLHNGVMNFDDLNYDSKGYSASGAYARSKLCNILFTKELARRLKGRDIHVYSLHPGVVNTDLSRHFGDTFFPGARWMFKNFAGYFLKTPEQGAQTSLYCALDEKSGKESGLYYSECKVASPGPKGEDMATARKLYDMSVVLTKVTDPLPQTDKPEKSTVKIGNVVHEF